MLKFVRSIVSVLPADSAVGPFCNWRTLPSVTSCTFFVARVGPDCLRSTACSGSGSTAYGRVAYTMMLVKPATVIQWHRQGFRLYWRWRSRSGRPSVDHEVRNLIPEMSSANPL
jgi:hypothetical protein